jgi:hypothetical protein
MGRIALALYHTVPRERVKKRFLILNVSTGIITLADSVACELQVERACSTSFYTF